MTVGQVFSHSRLSTFEDCPKRFEYRYVLKIPTETEGIEAFVGKRVHEVLERLYLAVERTMMPSLSRVLDRYEKLFEQAYDAARVRIVREGTTVDFYRDYGARCLTDYYRRHYPFDADKTLGIEERVTFSLDADDRYRFQGIIDRLVETKDGTIEIHDYKTGRRVPSAAELDRDRQLALYQIGLTPRFGERPMRLVWHYLQRNRQYTSTRTAEQLEALRIETMKGVDRIRQEFEFKPKRSGLCDWCEYNDRCPIYPRKNRQPDADSVSPAQPRPLTGQLQLFS